jgi:hypothetical protein
MLCHNFGDERFETYMPSVVGYKTGQVHKVIGAPAEDTW